jgi:hypothetical protein
MSKTSLTTVPDEILQGIIQQERNEFDNLDIIHLPSECEYNFVLFTDINGETHELVK